MWALQAASAAVSSGVGARPVAWDSATARGAPGTRPANHSAISEKAAVARIGFFNASICASL